MVLIAEFYSIWIDMTRQTDPGQTIDKEVIVIKVCTVYKSHQYFRNIMKKLESFFMPPPAKGRSGADSVSP